MRSLLKNSYGMLVVVFAVVIVVSASSCVQKGAQNNVDTVESNLNDSVASYLVIQEALSADSVDGVKDAASNISASANAAIKLAESDMEKNTVVIKAAKMLSASATPFNADNLSLDAAREGFHALSDVVIDIVNNHVPAETTANLKQFHCPMAKGSWLQKGDEAANPYYGSAMLKCGSMVDRPIAGCDCANREKCSKTKDGEECDQTSCDKCKHDKKCGKCTKHEAHHMHKCDEHMHDGTEKLKDEDVEHEHMHDGIDEHKDENVEPTH